MAEDSRSEALIAYSPGSQFWLTGFLGSFSAKRFPEFSHHVIFPKVILPREQEPFGMEDPEGDPSYRVIPADVSLDQLMITHDYYDHRDADKDINIVFPLTRLKELALAGTIGGTASFHYSFMGHIDGRKLFGLLHGTAPQVARRLRVEGVDAILLTPA